MRGQVFLLAAKEMASLGEKRHAFARLNGRSMAWSALFSGFYFSFLDFSLLGFTGSALDGLCSIKGGSIGRICTYRTASIDT
jgi:hypothetical protein